MEDEIENARYGFSAYKNYLAGLSFLIDSSYQDYSSILASLKNIRLRHGSDTNKIRSLLFNSWNSEALLNLPKFLDEGFVKFSNHWSPVQSYYAIYLALRALITAREIGAKGDHRTTLQVCVSNFIITEKLFPKPWNIICSYESSFKNLPCGFQHCDLNIQENPYHFRDDENKLINNFRMFLKTTRERVIDEKANNWKRKNPTKRGARMKLPKGKRAELDVHTRDLSFLDCFYRLRTRSNYRDVDIFILGSDTYDSRKYLDSLCNITDKTLFVLESYIAQSVGVSQLQKWINQYKTATQINFVQQEVAGITRRKRFFPN